MRPHCWLSDEWFSPQNVPGIGIPFYLVHPRLIRLERSMMLEAEGASRAECMRILRHEAGHAIQHGYRLHRRPSYQRLFGKSSTKYPTSYRPNPASRHFVQHLRAYYAQAHPDEDFAETFAVWMQPRARWRKRYQGWGALRKLEYVDALMEELEGKRPPVRTRERVAPVSQLTSTLRAHYDEKRAFYAVDFPSTYDRELCRVFSNSPKDAKRELASRFITRHAKEIRALVVSLDGRVRVHDRSAAARHDRAEPDAQAARAPAGQRGAAGFRRHARRAVRALPLPPTGVDPVMSRAGSASTRRRLRVLVLMETGSFRPTTSRR